MATLALFYAVGRWNGYSDALLYMKKTEFYPLQLLLYNIIPALKNMVIVMIILITPRPFNLSKISG